MLTFVEIGFIEDPVQRCAELASVAQPKPVLFIGSSDSEVQAFISATACFGFTQPAEGEVCNGVKCSSARAHLSHLLSDGKNIAMRGGLFNTCDDAMLKAVWYNGYILVTHGDSIFWTDKIGRYDSANVEEAIRRKQLVPVARDTYMLSSAHRPDYVLGMLKIPPITYNGRLLTTLTAGGRSGMYWSPQPYFISAFREAYLFHTMPAASSLAAYLQIFGVQSRVEGKGQNHDFASLLHIVTDDKFNEKGEDAAAYTARWYLKEKSAIEDVGKDMRNVLLQVESGEKSGLTAFAMPNDIIRNLKDGTLRPVFRGRGFPAVPGADCGDYSSARILCYCANTHFPMASAAYLRKNGVAFDQDAYALYHMLRFIGRSAIRNGESVTVYVPSKRMRGLLRNWMEEQTA